MVWKSPRYNRNRSRKARKVNRKYKLFGMTPDYAVSPIDFVPPLAFYNKGRKGYKLAKRAKTALKAGFRYKSRRKGSSSSSKNRRKRRGNYYYYRGKRYYRK